MRMTFWKFSAIMIFFLGLSPASASIIDETGHGRGKPAKGAPVKRAFKGTSKVTASGRPSSGLACWHCHSDKSSGRKYPKGLGRENDNGLCYSCHQQEELTGVFPRPEIYETSDHRINPRVVWPGPHPPARREPDAAGKCLNCHNPHGAKDRTGVIPSLLIAREEELCIACHGRGVAVTDIAREVRKPYSHLSVRNSGKHRADEGGDFSAYSHAAGNRHAACSDCHNAHAVAGDPLPPVPPRASSLNARVGRVRVLNGAAGSIPAYEYRAASDLAVPALEYELCFKCHSSWTKQPPGQQDMAVLFNVNNASFHPVEAQGKNPGIDPVSFAGGRGAMGMIFCGDCHGSDDSGSNGPHGSRFPGMLKKNYTTRSFGGAMTRDELCFACHNFDTYAGQSGMFQQASRFNPALSPKGHVFHSGQRNVPCYACHDSHGSPRFPALIVTGRMPGIISFSVNANGGTCLPTCHGMQSYRINYPR